MDRGTRLKGGKLQGNQPYSAAARRAIEPAPAPWWAILRVRGFVARPASPCASAQWRIRRCFARAVQHFDILGIAIDDRGMFKQPPQ